MLVDLVTTVPQKKTPSTDMPKEVDTIPEPVSQKTGKLNLGKENFNYPATQAHDSLPDIVFYHAQFSNCLPILNTTIDIVRRSGMPKFVSLATVKTKAFEVVDYLIRDYQCLQKADQQTFLTIFRKVIDTAERNGRAAKQSIKECRELHSLIATKPSYRK